MSKKEIDRAREIAQALENAKSKDSNKPKKPSYAHVRKARRGDATPTFASLSDKPVGEDQDGAVG